MQQEPESEHIPGKRFPFEFGRISLTILRSNVQMFRLSRMVYQCSKLCCLVLVTRFCHLWDERDLQNILSGISIRRNIVVSLEICWILYELKSVLNATRTLLFSHHSSNSKHSNFKTHYQSFKEHRIFTSWQKAIHNEDTYYSHSEPTRSFSPRKFRSRFFQVQV